MFSSNLPRDIFGGVKRLAKSTLLGTGPLSNLTARHESDLEAGVERLTDGNWDELVARGSEEDVWMIIVCVGAVGGSVGDQD